MRHRFPLCRRHCFTAGLCETAGRSGSAHGPPPGRRRYPATRPEVPATGAETSLPSPQGEGAGRRLWRNRADRKKKQDSRVDSTPSRCEPGPQRGRLRSRNGLQRADESRLAAARARGDRLLPGKRAPCGPRRRTAPLGPAPRSPRAPGATCADRPVGPGQARTAAPRLSRSAATAQRRRPPPATALFGQIHSKLTEKDGFHPDGCPACEKLRKIGEETEGHKRGSRYRKILRSLTHTGLDPWRKP